MKNSIQVLIDSVAVLLLVTVIAAGQEAAGQSATNGIYGGYVGSDRWFSMMRQSAANQAMLQALAGTRDPRRVPPDYVEFAGLIVFPGGNPFPKGRLPDLRIEARDKSADPVERAPFVDDSGGFYTVFKKGQTYDVSWMYYFGGRETFASIYVKPEGSPQRGLAIEYTPKGSGSEAPTEPAPTSPAEAKPCNPLLPDYVQKGCKK